MAVAVQAQRAQPRERVEGALDLAERFVDGAPPGGQFLRRDPIVGEQPVARPPSEAGRVERLAVDERPLGADRVQPADEAADPFERALVVELGRAAATPLGDGPAMAGRRGEGRRVAGQAGHEPARLDGGLQRPGRNDRHLGGSEFEGEAVLLQDLLVVPAAGAVELGHHDRAFRARLGRFQVDLEHPVLVGVELDQPAVAAQSDGVERIEHDVRMQVVVGRLVDAVAGLRPWRCCRGWVGRSSAHRMRLAAPVRTRSPGGPAPSCREKRPPRAGRRAVRRPCRAIRRRAARGPAAPSPRPARRAPDGPAPHAP